MGFEIDHIFICTEAGAPEAQRLRAFGLTEGKPNTHPGQGTACRRFFFENAYLELLWIDAPAEAQSEQSRRTRLWERWSGRAGGACPFGLCVRPAANQADDFPFATWDYRPSYLPAGLSFGIAKNSEVLAEPFLCHLGSGQRPDCYANARQQPLRHLAGLREITRVRLVGPYDGRISSELKAMVEVGLIELRQGDKHRVEIGFAGESHRKQIDFRPALPLIFRW
jgi:hypothetical protein